MARQIIPRHITQLELENPIRRSFEKAFLEAIKASSSDGDANVEAYNRSPESVRSDAISQLRKIGMGVAPKEVKEQILNIRSKLGGPGGGDRTGYWAARLDGVIKGVMTAYANEEDRKRDFRLDRFVKTNYRIPTPRTLTSGQQNILNRYLVELDPVVRKRLFDSAITAGITKAELANAVYTRYKSEKNEQLKRVLGNELKSPPPRIPSPVAPVWYDIPDIYVNSYTINQIPTDIKEELRKAVLRDAVPKLKNHARAGSKTANALYTAITNTKAKALNLTAAATTEDMAASRALHESFVPSHRVSEGALADQVGDLASVVKLAGNRANVPNVVVDDVNRRLQTALHVIPSGVDKLLRGNDLSSMMVVSDQVNSSTIKGTSEKDSINIVLPVREALVLAGVDQATIDTIFPLGSRQGVIIAQAAKTGSEVEDVLIAREVALKLQHEIKSALSPADVARIEAEETHIPLSKHLMIEASRTETDKLIVINSLNAEARVRSPYLYPNTDLPAAEALRFRKRGEIRSGEPDFRHDPNYQKGVLDSVDEALEQYEALVHEKERNLRFLNGKISRLDAILDPVHGSFAARRTARGRLTPQEETQRQALLERRERLMTQVDTLLNYGVGVMHSGLEFNDVHNPIINDALKDVFFNPADANIFTDYDGVVKKDKVTTTELVMSLLADMPLEGLAAGKPNLQAIQTPMVQDAISGVIQTKVMEAAFKRIETAHGGLLPISAPRDEFLKLWRETLAANSRQTDLNVLRTDLENRIITQGGIAGLSPQLEQLYLSNLAIVDVRPGAKNTNRFGLKVNVIASDPITIGGRIHLRQAKAEATIFEVPSINAKIDEDLDKIIQINAKIESDIGNIAIQFSSYVAMKEWFDHQASIRDKFKMGINIDKMRDGVFASALAYLSREDMQSWMNFWSDRYFNSPALGRDNILSEAQNDLERRIKASERGQAMAYADVRSSKRVNQLTEVLKSNKPWSLQALYTDLLVSSIIADGGISLENIGLRGPIGQYTKFINPGSFLTYGNPLALGVALGVNAGIWLGKKVIPGFTAVEHIPVLGRKNIWRTNRKELQFIKGDVTKYYDRWLLLSGVKIGAHLNKVVWEEALNVMHILTTREGKTYFNLKWQYHNAGGRLTLRLERWAERMMLPTNHNRSGFRFEFARYISRRRSKRIFKGSGNVAGIAVTFAAGAANALARMIFRKLEVVVSKVQHGLEVWGESGRIRGAPARAISAIFGENGMGRLNIFGEPLRAFNIGLHGPGFDNFNAITVDRAVNASGLNNTTMADLATGLEYPRALLLGKVLAGLNTWILKFPSVFAFDGVKSALVSGLPVLILVRALTGSWTLGWVLGGSHFVLSFARNFAKDFFLDVKADGSVEFAHPFYSRHVLIGRASMGGAPILNGPIRERFSWKEARHLNHIFTDFRGYFKNIFTGTSNFTYGAVGALTTMPAHLTVNQVVNFLDKYSLDPTVVELEKYAGGLHLHLANVSWGDWKRSYHINSLNTGANNVGSYISDTLKRGLSPESIINHVEILNRWYGKHGIPDVELHYKADPANLSSRTVGTLRIDVKELWREAANHARTGTVDLHAWIDQPHYLLPDGSVLTKGEALAMTGAGRDSLASMMYEMKAYQTATPTELIHGATTRSNWPSTFAQDEKGNLIPKDQFAVRFFKRTYKFLDHLFNSGGIGEGARFGNERIPHKALHALAPANGDHPLTKVLIPNISDGLNALTILVLLYNINPGLAIGLSGLYFFGKKAWDIADFKFKIVSADFKAAVQQKFDNAKIFNILDKSLNRTLNIVWFAQISASEGGPLNALFVSSGQLFQGLGEIKDGIGKIFNGDFGGALEGIGMGAYHGALGGFGLMGIFGGSFAMFQVSDLVLGSFFGPIGGIIIVGGFWLGDIITNGAFSRAIMHVLGEGVSAVWTFIGPIIKDLFAANPALFIFMSTGALLGGIIGFFLGSFLGPWVGLLYGFIGAGIGSALGWLLYQLNPFGVSDMLVKALTVGFFSFMAILSFWMSFFFLFSKKNLSQVVIGVFMMMFSILSILAIFHLAFVFPVDYVATTYASGGIPGSGCPYYTSYNGTTYNSSYPGELCTQGNNVGANGDKSHIHDLAADIIPTNGNSDTIVSPFNGTIIAAYSDTYCVDTSTNKQYPIGGEIKIDISPQDIGETPQFATMPQMTYPLSDVIYDVFHMQPLSNLADGKPHQITRGQAIGVITTVSQMDALMAKYGYPVPQNGYGDGVANPCWTGPHGHMTLMYARVQGTTVTELDGTFSPYNGLQYSCPAFNAYTNFQGCFAPSNSTVGSATNNIGCSFASANPQARQYANSCDSSGSIVVNTTSNPPACPLSTSLISEINKVASQVCVPPALLAAELEYGGGQANTAACSYNSYNPSASSQQSYPNPILSNAETDPSQPIDDQTNPRTVAREGPTAIFKDTISNVSDTVNKCIQHAPDPTTLNDALYTTAVELAQAHNPSANICGGNACSASDLNWSNISDVTNAARSYVCSKKDPADPSTTVGQDFPSCGLNEGSSISSLYTYFNSACFNSSATSSN